MGSGEFPKNLNIDEGSDDMYQELSEKPIFRKRDAPMKSIFLYSLALGWCSKPRIRKQLKKKKGSIPSSTLSEDEVWLLNAIAFVETGDINIILDKSKVAEIAEEYANSGIEKLYSIIMDPHNFSDDYRKLDEHVMKLSEVLIDRSDN